MEGSCNRRLPHVSSSHIPILLLNTALLCQVALIALVEVLLRWEKRLFNRNSGHMSFDGCPKTVCCYIYRLFLSLTYCEPGLADDFARVERPEQSCRSARRLQNVLPWVAFNGGRFSQARCLFIPPR